MTYWKLLLPPLARSLSIAAALRLIHFMLESWSFPDCIVKLELSNEFN
jgi:hypothetical protein